MISKIDIDKYLKTDFIGRNIKYYDTLSSTNIKAKEIAEKSSEGTIIIAEEQTMGKGRLGRNWISPKGKGLWFSVILKPNISPDKVSKVTLIGAAAVYESLKEIGVLSKIKWPNDIVIKGKKVCGILTEMSFHSEKRYNVIMGIGINVNLDKEDFDDEVKNKATSLKIIAGDKVDRNKLLSKILNNFERLYIPFKENEDISETIKISREGSILIGKYVRIIKNSDEKIVKVLDIDNKGQLIVKYDNGEIEEIFSGEVSIRGMEGYI